MASTRREGFGSVVLLLVGMTLVVSMMKVERLKERVVFDWDAKLQDTPVSAEDSSSGVSTESPSRDDTTFRSISELYSPPNITGLPRWVLDYFSWHSEMRAKFPDRQLLEHPDAPKVLINYCIEDCAGTHDRLGNAAPLFVANQTGRVLLFKWFTPMDCM